MGNYSRRDEQMLHVCFPNVKLQIWPKKPVETKLEIISTHYEKGYGQLIHVQTPIGLFLHSLCHSMKT